MSQTTFETSSLSSKEFNNVLTKFQLDKKLGKRMLVDKGNIEPVLIESLSKSENFPPEPKLTQHRIIQTLQPI